MDKLHRRRVTAAKRTSENNRNKFIVKYVEAIHGDIHEEAQQLYGEIKNKNPGRKDLTKTVEFMQKVTPFRSIPVYYYTRQKESKPARKNTKGTSSTTQMVLNIPLMEFTEMPATVMATSTTNDVEMSPSQPGDEQEEDREMPQPQPGDEQEDQPSHLDMPYHIYEEVLQEIRQDPELFQIFNDFNVPDHDGENNDDMWVNVLDHDGENNDDMWDSFVIDEQTPLERELSRIGY